jgi:hypothetical protein
LTLQKTLKVRKIKIIWIKNNSKKSPKKEITKEPKVEKQKSQELKPISEHN